MHLNHSLLKFNIQSHYNAICSSFLSPNLRCLEIINMTFIMQFKIFKTFMALNLIKLNLRLFLDFKDPQGPYAQKFSKYVLNWSKVTVKTIKKSISNKCCSFELSIHQRILKIMYHISTKILSSTTVFNIDNNLFIIITTISEGSCDTEDSALSSHKIHLNIY